MNPDHDTASTPTGQAAFKEDADPNFENVQNLPATPTAGSTGGRGGWDANDPQSSRWQRGIGAAALLLSGAAALLLAALTLMLLVSRFALPLVFLLSLLTVLLLLLHAWAWSAFKSRTPAWDWPVPQGRQQGNRVYRRVVLGFAALFTLLSVGVIAVQLAIVQPLLLLLTALTLASVFPISYVAYDQFPRRFSADGAASGRDQTARQQNIQRLTLDFLLLLPGIHVQDFDVRQPESLKTLRFCRDRAEAYYNRFNSIGEYALHLTLAVLATLFGLAFFVWQPPETLVSAAALSAMRFGFVGAYLFAVQLVYRRYTTIDLQPTVYLYCAQTIIAGLAFNFVAFQALTLLVSSSSELVGQGALGILAFSLGYFPFIAIRWFSRITYTALVLPRGRGEYLALEMIDGINPFHETRLRDQGIDNVQNLACANLFELLTTTNYNAQQLIDWVDQALLYVYLDPQKIEVFRGASIRTASDFWKQWQAVCSAPPDDQARRSLVDKLQSTDAHLSGLFDATHEGPNADEIKAFWQRKPQEGTLAQMLWRLTQAERLERTASEIYESFTVDLDQTHKTILNLYDWLRLRYADLTGEAMLMPSVEELRQTPVSSNPVTAGGAGASGAASSRLREGD